MIIVKTRSALSKYLDHWRSQSQSIGFVPTMGALHEGHIALISQAKQQTQKVVCSIFVNPTQFNDPADFKKYPITLEDDIVKLSAPGTDILFLPSVDELYQEGTVGLEKYDLGYLETVLEGAFRPGHFQGVCQVMSRLLDAVKADKLFMGQKDYQQCMVVAQLIELKKIETELIPCPTIREEDGLAMSSRNKRLDEAERKNAIGIYKALSFIKSNLKEGPLDSLKKQAAAIIEQHHFKIDYIEIADSKSLQLINNWDGKQQLVALAAAFQNEVRLIDNMIITS